MLNISLIPMTQVCTCSGKLIVFPELKYCCMHTYSEKSTNFYSVQINEVNMMSFDTAHIKALPAYNNLIY